MSIGYHSAVVDPRWIHVEFFGGWNREMEANDDTEALLFTSGPTFARGRGNGDLGMRLHGDLMLANGTWLLQFRSAHPQPYTAQLCMALMHRLQVKRQRGRQLYVHLRLPILAL